MAACVFLSENHVGPCHLLEKSPCSWGKTDPNVLPGSNRKRMGLTGMTALKSTSRVSQIHTSWLNTGHYIKTSRHHINRLWNPELFGEGGNFYSFKKKKIFTHSKLQKTTDRYSETQLCNLKGNIYPSHHSSLDITSEPGPERIWYCNCSKDGDRKADQQVSTEKGTCNYSLWVLHFKLHQNCNSDQAYQSILAMIFSVVIYGQCWLMIEWF